MDLTNDFDAKLWERLLCDADDNALLKALVTHVRSGNRFSPNAGEIAALCEGDKDPCAGAEADAYIERVKAWMLTNGKLPKSTVKIGMHETEYKSAKEALNGSVCD